MKIDFVLPEPPTEVVPNLYSPRGAKLAVRIWKPNGMSPSKPPKALVVIVHGGGWHTGYFSNLGTELATNHNILVVGYDQPGCGYSEKEPSAPDGKWIMHVESFDDFIADIFNAVDYAKQYLLDADTAKNIPIFLLGESYGGVQVLKALLDVHADERYKNTHYVTGAILLGGVVQVKAEFLPPKPVIKILTWLSVCFPRMKLPATDFSQTFNEAFGDERWANIARSDTKVHISPQPTMKMAAVSLNQGDVIMSRAKEYQTPILAIHSAQDCRAEPTAVEELCSKIRNNKAEYVPILNTTGHQLLQDKPEITIMVINKVTKWINEQLEKKN